MNINALAGRLRDTSGQHIKGLYDDEAAHALEQCAATIAQDAAKINRLSRALLNACDLLEGWVNTKCPALYKVEHLEHIAALRVAGDRSDVLGPDPRLIAQRPRD